MSNLSPIETKLVSFSQDPPRFMKELRGITVSFNLTWQEDIYIIFTTCCTHEENLAFGLLLNDGQMMCMPETSRILILGELQCLALILKVGLSRGDHGREHYNHMTTYLIEAVKKATISCSKLSEIVQVSNENPVYFIPGCLRPWENILAQTTRAQKALPSWLFISSVRHPQILDTTPKIRSETTDSFPRIAGEGLQGLQLLRGVLENQTGYEGMRKR